MKLKFLGLLGAGLLAGPMLAQAFPIAAPGTEGLKVLVAGTDPIIATFQGHSAAFSNDLYLMLDGMGDAGDDGDTSNDLFIFNNQSAMIGDTVDLGAFGIGTELMFRLRVNNTGFDYFTGPAARNPDGFEHARVQSNWQPNESLVSFEDLFDAPEGINGFNDLSFSFTNTVSSGVPEPGTLALLGLSLAGFGFAGRRNYR